MELGFECIVAIALLALLLLFFFVCCCCSTALLLLLLYCSTAAMNRSPSLYLMRTQNLHRHSPAAEIMKQGQAIMWACRTATLIADSALLALLLLFLCCCRSTVTAMNRPPSL